MMDWIPVLALAIGLIGLTLIGLEAILHAYRK